MSNARHPHVFAGRWITNDEFCDLPPRKVYHRQLDKLQIDCSAHRNRHILFRRRFVCPAPVLYITADDFYKLYLNGRFVTEGPASAYSFRYHYQALDVTPYLTEGENVIAVHTLYQGLINRVWQSGDQRHGLLLDLEIDGARVLESDERFLTAVHSGYREIGTVGYDTGFLEEYDSRVPEVGFARPDFDDRAWEHARIAAYADHTLVPQATEPLVFETIQPVSQRRQQNTLLFDFGANYAGYLCATARGQGGETITVQMGQELNEDGTVRHAMRANCVYAETWLLREGESVLEQYDYKAFRYSALTHMILTGRDDMLRKLIDDAFTSAAIEPSLMNCLNSSCMQETAEAPLMLVKAVWRHYRYTGDVAYLAENYPKVVRLLETFRSAYEGDGLLGELDKWCVVEWPAPYRDGYDVDLTQGKVCHEPHLVSNVLYLEAVRLANRMAAALAQPLREGATTTFEGWGKETKWNTSLFHLTVAYAAVFLADIDLRHLLG